MICVGILYPIKMVPRCQIGKLHLETRLQMKMVTLEDMVVYGVPHLIDLRN